MITPKWEGWRMVSKLDDVSKLAKQLDDAVYQIYRNASPAVLAKLRKTALEAIEVSEITEAATKLADELQAEADAEVT